MMLKWTDIALSGHSQTQAALCPGGLLVRTSVVMDGDSVESSISTGGRPSIAMCHVPCNPIEAKAWIEANAAKS